MTSSGDAPKILDVRWSLAQPDGRAEHERAHLPGAIHVDLENELSSHGEPGEGRHPLPTPEQLQQAARRWGLDDGDTVVVHDADTGVAAARAWWLLRHAGMADVRILDGGLAAWRAVGGAVESGTVEPEPGNVRLGWGHMPVVDIDEAAALPGGGILLDVRAPERYRGEVEPMDPVAGHIPGAVNAPNLDLLGPDGTFRTPEEIRDLLGGLGVDGRRPVAAYCGSGVNAAHAVAAMESAGLRAALYPGSWSQWSNTPGRPIGTAARPTQPAEPASVE
ncbi:sulfurtransferase [Tessaracoccus rhinocerotis]|uniref:Sulfurtransferase n=2 Tax=Tessaracoccus rhinocerotis TaxID=1689449 RepID=A0A553K6E6_9ACTN|nr:sulfurtransferase [Tessaracoccus rhinocerotis]